MTWGSLYARLLLRAVASPSLAIALIRVGWRFRRRNWYSQFPFLPLPSGDYVHWRIHTAYGDLESVPPIADVIRYVWWAARGR